MFIEDIHYRDKLALIPKKEGKKECMFIEDLTEWTSRLYLLKTKATVIVKTWDKKSMNNSLKHITSNKIISLRLYDVSEF